MDPTRTLLLTAAITLMAGCSCSPPGAGDAADDDLADAGIPLVSMDPQDGDQDVFIQDDIELSFGGLPDEVTVSLDDLAGELTSSGADYVFDPAEDLEPETDYTLTVQWSPSDFEPAVVTFRTSRHGTAVLDEEAMVGETLSLDLSTADFVEPPGLGPVIGDQLEGTPLLVMPLPDSDFGAGELHVMGALGIEEGGVITQDPCAESVSFTAGPDGVIGTLDDTPADWLNPIFDLGPADLVLSVAGVEARLYDVFLTGIVHPERVDMRGVSFEGILDTRALAGALGGGPEAACELLLDVAGVACEECGEPVPGEFCIDVVAENGVAVRVDGLQLLDVDCADVITRALAGDCDPETADAYDPDGNGTWPLCASYP